MLVADKDGMRREFEHLLALEVDRLLSAHRTFLPVETHPEV